MELNFKQHPMLNGIEDTPLAEAYGDLKQAIYKAPCGLEFSIVFGKLFFSNGIDTYEIWLHGSMAYHEVLDDDMYDDPKGYLTMDEIEEYIETACKKWEKK